ncbi:DUF3592 domain-containing protein [Geodermatophilus sp. DSM 44513]|uniref:DUF3592 domain-containing protein n=1 Tax=Geodermatophilus sp. DSM 44513 TaxID=1528104 RepID=UPI00126EC5C0|nr:DUF3592 domain-containing protein [Geodermatophilus sp. DSM 44513]WNV77209.1 hypothetical protein RTG05_08035 [Geodermatophilus sp. DSM 44513]
MGRAGRTVAPGRAARRLALVLAAVAAAAAVLALVTWARVADLRDLDRLVRTSAEVVEVDDRRRGPDDLVVRFATDRDTRQATVPWSGSARAGDPVEVAYSPADPGRVRTVEGWSPWYQTWAVYAVVLAIAAVAVGAFGLVSRLRGGRWEHHAPVGEAPREALGRRVVRGTLFAYWLFGGLGLLPAGLLGGAALTRPADRVALLAGAAGLLAFCVAMAAGLHWWYGRDGVWVTDAELVARRRRRVRRWPWAQVLELGVVVEKGSATVAAARVDDGPDDGIGTDGWVTLARPSAGPLGAHAWSVRFRALADERELAFTEGLAGDELADSLGSTYSLRRRRTPGRRRPPT